MLRLGLGPQASGSINPHGSGGVLFLSSVIISGCDPSTINGTYTRSSAGTFPTPEEPDRPIVGDETFTASNGNTIEWYLGVRWRLNDVANGDAQLLNDNQSLDVTQWSVENATSFGTATNIYSQV